VVGCSRSGALALIRFIGSIDFIIQSLDEKMALPNWNIVSLAVLEAYIIH